MRLALAVVVITHAANVGADATVSVTLNQQGTELAATLGLSVPELIATAEARIDELYKVSRLDDLLRAFGNTAAFAQRGLGVDYDTDPGDVIFGFAAGGVHGDVAIGTTNELLGGSIINFAGMAGVNLGRWNHARWTVFGNGFYESTTIHGLTGHLLTLGSHVQYQIVPASAPGKARWTGIAATTGLEYARWTVGTSSAIDSHFTAEGSNGKKTVHMSSTGTLDVLSSTFTMPIEVTTGVRLGYIFSFYGGGGLALTGGDSTITAQLDSVLTINHERLPVGNAIITGTGSQAPSPATVHAVAGFAIHTPHVRALLQGAFAPGELAVSLGLRGAF